ncbi:MAG: gliding motility-associated C-terminal domain-containing protein, partial [Arcicella sp.]|nr:gliding motility-associated C-terminal domain-containing protein [Arcicella sp.]
KADQFDPDSCPNSGTEDGEDDTDSVTVNGRGADLSLEKFVSNATGTPAEPKVGEDVTFTLRVHNAGPELARNTIVKDYLPVELALSEKIDFYNPSEGILSRTIPIIQPNTYVDLTFKAKVLKGGLITNKAEIFDTRQYDPDSQPNTGTEDGQDDVGVVTLVGQEADLSLNKIVNHTDVTVGDTLLYMVQVNNAGPSEATNVEISDILPDGLQLLESNNGTLVGNVLTFKVPSIDKKGFAVFGYKVLVTKEGNLINKAQVTKSDQPDPDSTPNNGKWDGKEDDEASCVVRAKLPCDKTPPSIIASKTELNCSENAILTALGCTGTVKWSDGQTGNTVTVKPAVSTAYTATCVHYETCPKSANCEYIISCISEVSKAVKITVTNLVAPVITVNKSQICGGDSIQLTSTGCVGTTVWSNGKTGNIITEKLSVTASFTAICRVDSCNSPRSNILTIKVGIDRPVVTCGRERLCVGESEVLTAHGCDGGKVTWSDGQIGKNILVKPTKTQYQFTAICELNTCKSEPSTPAYFIVTDCRKDTTKIIPKPTLAVCKEVRTPKLVQEKTYDITYDFRLVNLGNADFEQIQVLDNLDEVFTDKGAKILNVSGLKADDGLVVNPNYDGRSNQQLLLDSQSKLLMGKVKSIQFTVRVDFSTAKVDTFYNSALGMAKAGKVVVQDISNNGFDVNPDGDSDPTNDSAPTPIRVQSIQKPVDEPKEIFIPEGFSPNGDGVNDLFVIDLQDKTLTINLQIYNRWGGLVYASEDYQNNWDGTANQGVNVTDRKGLPDGTYYYMVKLSNGKEFVRSMTLMR